MRNSIIFCIFSADFKNIDYGILNRVFDTQLSEYLEAFGAVLIEGPKWCDKTTTATQHALIVLTGGQYAFTREDGVKVIPIGCLRP